MNNGNKFFNLKKLFSYVDWKLLLFLLLFLNVKLAVKIPAIILIYILQFDFRFKFSFKNARLPLFYPLIMGIAILDFILNHNYTNGNYIIVLLLGIGFWAMCILAIHQVKLAVERNITQVIHQTILVFFIINAVVSLLNLTAIIWETHAFNPYIYQGQYQKYFISTGDFIKGLTFDTSTTNAILNAFGVLYFITRKKTLMTLVCMAVLLLTGSNFTNVFLLIILAYIFIFNSTRNQKSIIAICLALMVLFMGKISPQNDGYFMKTVKTIFYQKQFTDPRPINPVYITMRPDSTLTPAEKRQKIAQKHIDSLDDIAAKKKVLKETPKVAAAIVAKPVVETKTGRIIIAKPDINSAPYQSLNTTPPEQRQLVDFIDRHKTMLPISGKPFHFTPVPGKVTGLVQTINFFKQHPAKIITGSGVGNFSSKLAFRATGLQFTGGYPAKHIYINPGFLANHLDIYLNFFSRSSGFHSLTNSPFSVYDQLLSEYGFPGLVILFTCYLWFFARRYKSLSYGIPLLLFVMAIFFIDYWFEQLSVMVLFELMMFLNIKEGEELVNDQNLIKQ